MVALARKSLLHAWRRFLPTTLAVAFASLMLLVQSSLLLGIFGSASVYMRTSGAQLWIGYPGTQTVELGQPVPEGAVLRVLLDPDVERIEPFKWLDGEWRAAGTRGVVSVFVSGIDPRPGGLMFSKALSPALRAALRVPDTVVVDRSDLEKLGTAVHQAAAVNGHTVRVIGVTSGLRALGGVNVVTSLATARRLVPGARAARDNAYYVAALRPGANPETVAARLAPQGSHPRYAVWTAAEFGARAARYWFFETGAGAGFVLLAGIIFISGALIASQSLVAAVASAVPEYATLRALGVSRRDLGKVVLEQACWVAAAGLAVAAGLMAIVAALARSQDVPAALDPLTAVVCMLAVAGIVAISGLAAAATLRRSDPALLLR
ncbi:MAG: ABC transporter permease [Gammaproteobacteria bacterium]